MTSQLKRILLKMIHLPSADQRWILRQLTAEQRDIFQRYHGFDLLEKAQRFRKLHLENTTTPESEPLPGYCTLLAMKAPLYIAIILEQGSYPWQSLFLKQFDSEHRIAALLDTKVPDIKAAVKIELFNEWQSRIDFVITGPNSKTENPYSFEDHMESAHG